MTDDDAGPQRTVDVDIVLPPTDVPPEAARVVVQVEDYSRADAPAEVVAQETMTDVALRPGGRLRCRLDVPAGRLDERDRYSVRVHVDVDGSGAIARGDLITMQSHPVLTGGHPDDVRVDVRLV